jgi:hypothetical protein
MVSPSSPIDRITDQIDPFADFCFEPLHSREFRFTRPFATYSVMRHSLPARVTKYFCPGLEPRIGTRPFSSAATKVVIVGNFPPFNTDCKLHSLLSTTEYSAFHSMILDFTRSLSYSLQSCAKAGVL